MAMDEELNLEEDLFDDDDLMEVFEDDEIDEF